jgi:hypothetical protein
MPISDNEIVILLNNAEKMPSGERFAYLKGALEFSMQKKAEKPKEMAPTRIIFPPKLPKEEPKTQLIKVKNEDKPSCHKKWGPIPEVKPIHTAKDITKVIEPPTDNRSLVSKKAKEIVASLLKLQPDGWFSVEELMKLINLRFKIIYSETYVHAIMFSLHKDKVVDSKRNGRIAVYKLNPDCRIEYRIESGLASH